MALDPLTTKALIDGGSKVLGSALRPAPAGPSRADSSAHLTADNSGFLVNTGSGSAAAASGINPLWLLALFGLGLLAWLKKK